MVKGDILSFVFNFYEQDMWGDKQKIQQTINTNIVAINIYLEKLPEPDRLEFLDKMKDIFFFYGLTTSILEDILTGAKVPFTYPEKRLPELEGATNALLFRLKYKLDYSTVVDNSNLQKTL